MATIIHRNSDRFKGIWLLEENALQAFDDIVEEEWNRLKEITKLKLDREVKNEFQDAVTIAKLKGEEIGKDPLSIETLKNKIRDRIKGSYLYNKNSRKLTVNMASGQKFQVSSFKELMEDPASQNHMPNKFSLNMRSETIDCDVEMEDNQIFIRVSPEQVQEASTIFLKFDQWTHRFIYPRWLYWWRQFRGFHFLVILNIVLFVAIWGIVNPGNKEFKIEVNQLLEDGLSEEEIPRALELLLISKSGQTSKNKSIQIKPWYKTFLIVSLAVAIIGNFPPTSRIAIGKGIISIQRQKKWLKFISVVLPSFIAMGILASAFGSALYEYFK